MTSVDRNKSIASLHVCRGNWSRDESILLAGPYTPLLDVFAETKPDLLALEFSTPRAGEMASLLEDARISREMALGLGAVNPRTDVVESPELIVDRARTALQWIPKDRLWLNPDCGFATFGNRPVNTVDIAGRKMRALSMASEMLRRQYASGE
jgi:5-methyltetrahydropteroyltriglutamate--homocysteine methyltransferase